jgi:16S rRNA (cytosine1402-N4)-methyltransferase
MMENYKKHYPVMLNEVICALSPKDDEIYVDATFGNGGYTEAVLQAANCKVIALDRDNTVMPRVEELKQKYGSRFDFRLGNFGNFDKLINENINGAMFDIGVSSMQLDETERGFSFSKDAPLDMRMGQTGQSAADLVNSLSETELANILYNYGEEKKSRAIAKKIVETRQIKSINSTVELANIIYAVLGRGNRQKIDPATRSFQALRIAVNDELNELQKGLTAATSRLTKGGRLVVVDFHSLEDRIVKTFLKNNSEKRTHVSRFKPLETKSTGAIFSFASKAIVPSDEELSVNNRSRSAKLRYAIKY